jgi:dolichol-phosphate mannosyltransferase
MKKKLSIVIPIFNEEKNITILLKKIISIINKKFIYEIIVMDDSSTDNSQKNIEKIQKRKINIYCITRKNKIRDLSQSCADGFKKCKYPYILVMDGDLQHNPSYIPALFKTITDTSSDIVIGARNFNQKNINLSLGVIRVFFSKFLIIMINFFLEKKTSDPMSGFFVFKKSLYINNKKKLFLKGYKILADLLYSTKKKIKSKDIVIKFNNRKEGSSKMNFKILIFLLIFIIEKWVKKYEKY